LVEGGHHLERALGAVGAPTAARAKALNGAAVMAINGGDSATARRRAEEGLALHEALGDAGGAAYSRFMLGTAVSGDGDLVKTQQLFEESIRTFRELGDEHSTLLVTRSLAATCARLGDHQRARALHEENLRRARATRNKRIEASTLGALADIAVNEDRVEEASSMLEASLRVHRGLGDLLDTAVDLCRFAGVLARKGKAGMATRLISSVEAQGEVIGARREVLGELNEKSLANVRTQLDDAAFAAAWEQGRTLTLDEAVALAIDSAS
jgi:ATP/maltotriose-dependent transcriptional regulator MalT